MMIWCQVAINSSFVPYRKNETDSLPSFKVAKSIAKNNQPMFATSYRRDSTELKLCSIFIHSLLVLFFSHILSLSLSLFLNLVVSSFSFFVIHLIVEFQVFSAFIVCRPSSGDEHTNIIIPHSFSVSISVTQSTKTRYFSMCVFTTCVSGKIWCLVLKTYHKSIYNYTENNFWNPCENDLCMGLLIKIIRTHNSLHHTNTNAPIHLYSRISYERYEGKILRLCIRTKGITQHIQFTLSISVLHSVFGLFYCLLKTKQHLWAWGIFIACTIHKFSNVCEWDRDRECVYFLFMCVKQHEIRKNTNNCNMYRIISCESNKSNWNRISEIDLLNKYHICWIVPIKITDFMKTFRNLIALIQFEQQQTERNWFAKTKMISRKEEKQNTDIYFWSIFCDWPSSGRPYK